MEIEAYDVSNAGYQIKRLIEKKSEPVMEKYGLRTIEIDILVMLYNGKNIDTATKITDKKHISKAHVSKSIDNLKKLGFIELNEDQGDKRISHIVLTDKASQVVREELGVYKECKDILFSGVTEYEKDILKYVLAKMVGNLTTELVQED